MKRLRDYIPFTNFEEKDKVVKYYAVSVGKPKTSYVATNTRNETYLKKLQGYFEGDPVVFAAINTLAWNTAMCGYTLLSEDDDAKLLVQQFFDAVDIEDIILQSTIDSLQFGDSFVEKVYKGKEFTGLHMVSPITMNIRVDDTGLTKAYFQKIKGRELADIKAEKIMHLKLFSKSNSPYGISILTPSRNVIERKLATDDAISTAIIRHGFGKYVVTVGTEENIPDEAIFEQISSKLENITSNNEFIVPGVIGIEEIDQKGISGVEEYYSYFKNQLITGMLCPEEALGEGRGATEATARIKEQMYERTIQSFQHRIAHLIKTQIIDELLEKNGKEPGIVKMRFHSVTSSDEAIKAKWLSMIQGTPGDEEGKPFSNDEVRIMFGFEPLESSNKKTSKKPTKETKKPTEEPKDKKKKGEQMDLLKKELNDIKSKMVK